MSRSHSGCSLFNASGGMKISRCKFFSSINISFACLYIVAVACLLGAQIIILVKPWLIKVAAAIPKLADFPLPLLAVITNGRRRCPLTVLMICLIACCCSFIYKY